MSTQNASHNQNPNSQMGKDGATVVRGNPRPAYLNNYQPKMTYSGHPIREVPWTLPYWTKSLCPECRKPIDARMFATDNKIFMEKECTEHGYFKEIISPDAKLYMDIFTFRFEDQRGVSNPLVNAGTDANCPNSCGICNMHHSTTSMANIDLTNRCDMRCPVCFANANAMGYIYEPTLEEVRFMLKTLRERKPVPCKVVQFSGGEPTCHPNFVEIVKMAKDMGFFQVQIATNGKNLSDFEFAQKCAEAGLDTLYLQFDGTTKDVYKKTRAEDVLETKIQTVENCRKVGIRVVLVPTIIRGLNDNQVGSIVKFALDYSDVITGISFQPVCFTGRINEKERLSQRYTNTDLIIDVENQTNGMVTRKNWFNLTTLEPFSRLSEALTGEPAFYVSCHPGCGVGGFVFVNPSNPSDAKSLTDFFDLKSALIELNDIAENIKRKNSTTFHKLLKKIGLAKASHLVGGVKAVYSIKKYFREDKAPKGLTFKRMLGVIEGYQDKTRGRAEVAEHDYGYRTVFVGGMHFQDVYNYDCERAKRCVIHHVAPNGKMYPFCTYNSGPYFREQVEETLQKTKIEDYKESGSPHASAKREKKFERHPSIPEIKVKDYGVVPRAEGSYSIPDNYGCCSTAKG